MSSPRLVHNAFFGPEFPISRIPEFMKWMSNYEALWWPLSMSGSGWTIHDRTWLDVRDNVKHISPRNGNQDKILVTMGT